MKLTKNEVNGLDILFFEISLDENFSENVLKKEINFGARLIFERFNIEDIKNIPEIYEFRKLLKNLGLDPSKNRISSESLLRRIVKQKKFPFVFPIVDLNNFLSMSLFLPVCVYKKAAIKPPITLRIGREGEYINSLRGRFNLYKKPVLEDKYGIFGSPFIDDVRVLLSKSERSAYGDIYFPSTFNRSMYIEKIENIVKNIQGVSIKFF